MPDHTTWGSREKQEGKREKKKKRKTKLEPSLSVRLPNGEPRRTTVCGLTLLREVNYWHFLVHLVIVYLHLVSVACTRGIFFSLAMPLEKGGVCERARETSRRVKFRKTIWVLYLEKTLDTSSLQTKGLRGEHVPDQKRLRDTPLRR